MPLTRALLLFLVPLLAHGLPGALASTTWHVDAGAAPPGSGTLAAPYASIQHAIDQPTTVHGDTLLIAPGLYLENVDYRGKSLLLRGRDGAERTMLHAARPGPTVLANASAQNGNVSLEGLTIRGAHGTAPGILVDGPTEAFLQVRRCIVRDNGGAGVLVEYDGWIFETTLAGNGRALVSQGLGIVILRNVIAWGNTDPMLLHPALHQIDYVLHQGELGCHACFSEDPRFWDLAGRDLRLRPSSPAIDAGFPASPPDPDGSRIDLGALPYDPFHAPGTSTHCDGTAALCPCGNGGAPGAGCEIAQATGGVSIGIRDFSPSGSGGGTAVILGTGYPPAALPGVTLIRSPAAEFPPVPFGDGLRCIATAGLVRVQATLATGGAVAISISHGAGAGTFHYQLWNRNAPASFCTPDAFNLSNALTVTW